MIDIPLVGNEQKTARVPATALVIFGASGDLTHRKLLPALVNLMQDRHLPEDFVVIGCARSKFSDDQFRLSIKEALDKYSRREIDSSVWDKFSQSVFYHPLDGNNLDDFERLRLRLERFKVSCGGKLNYLYYFATSPTFFGPISENLKKAGLIEPPGLGDFRTSIVVEKPFGRDLPSAHSLNVQLRDNFAEEQIFRIDHYLGKETVQNIGVFRFGNSIFEPLWNSRYIDCIQISVCENFGVGTRAGYFDENGIVRDIVQNHVLQMLSLLCMEPPISLNDADSIRNEKVKVLKMLKRIDPGKVEFLAVRGQYEAGTIADVKVPGYLNENGIAPGSKTETYVALRVEIDNWRWAGVPVFIRAGKCLPKRITEMSLLFKQPPASMFGSPCAIANTIGSLERNVLSIQVQPNEGISIGVNSKPPGPQLKVRRVAMDFDYDESFGIPSPDAYERLLLDAMKGDATLFTRDDEIEEAWHFLEPLFEGWSDSNSRCPVHRYPAGTWGPQEADTLIGRSGFRWRAL